MKKKVSFVLCVLLTGLMLIGVCACSSGSSGGGSTPKISGKTESWGNITVLIPDGMKLVTGNIISSTDEDAVTVQDNTETFKYISITINDESSIDAGLAMTKDINSDCKDVSLKLDNGTFTGFTYNSMNVECVHLKGKIGDKFVQVGSAGFTSDSEILAGVLSSIVLK